MKKYLSIFVSTIFIFICGCGGSGVDTQNYQDPTLTNYKINTIAVLPIRNSYISLGDSKEINRYFMTGVSRKGLKYKIIGPDEAIEKLNKDSLVDIYYEYLKSYSNTGIPNTETIKKVGVSLNCDAIVQGEIYDIIKIDGQYGSHKGETRCKVRYSAVSTKDGKVIWETSTESYDKTDFTTSGAPPLMNVIMNAMESIIEGLPGNK